MSRWFDPSPRHHFILSEIKPTIIATDVQYDNEAGTAVAAAVAFSPWPAAVPSHEWTVEIDHIEEYEPGQFYRRELPCLRALLDAAPVTGAVIIVDGHVWLSTGRPGLGRHLYGALGERTPVVGVAKRPFHLGCAVKLYRGRSKNPLHITAAGLHEVSCLGWVKAMHGPHRIPTMLKRVDQLCRGLG